jgi:DNA polymerase III sliding clamp (beta) subunit (PCNA family)
MNLTKKQVKAFLDVISSDETRPILTNAKIDTYEGRPVLVGTDSYKLAVITLTDDILPLMGYLIPRAELIKWHKLASHKDYLTEADLQPMATPDDQAMFRNDDQDKSQYPKWQPLVTRDKNEAVTHISINAQFMATMQTLADADGYNGGLVWEFGGALAPVIAEHNQNIYVVMPRKR